MTHSPPLQYIQALRERYVGLCEGKVADYIPELSSANPEWFGISLAMRDGHVYEAGNTDQLFTIQSISKAFVYGLALEENGKVQVAAKIGVEPSGEAFNAISLNGRGAPFNPMINAGAIAACGLISGATTAEKIGRILDCLSVYAGRNLTIDERVYHSESETGHRNRAIAWMLRNFQILDQDPNIILEAYFQQCSILVTSRDLAIMGATLANGGVNPMTGKRAISSEYVDNVLSVMGTCGMYDFAGEWLHRVGLPAKSGVSGGIMAVLPSQLGIGVFSPRLDDKGNSVRGIRVCTDLSRDLALHLFSVPSIPKTSVRLSYYGGQVTSKRRRAPRETEILRRQGQCIRVHELQGEMVFSTVEPVVRSLVDESVLSRYFILNFTRVISIDAVSVKLLTEAASNLFADKKLLLFVCIGKFGDEFRRVGIGEQNVFPSDDMALEYCETQLLAQQLGTNNRDQGAKPLAECDLCRGMREEDVEYLEARLKHCSFSAGEKIIRAGEAANEVFILTKGSVQVTLPHNGQLARRLDVFGAGMTFGEMAFIDGATRSADVIALEAAECRVITRQLFEGMEREQPQTKFTLLANIARNLSHNVRRINMELSALHGY